MAHRRMIYQLPHLVREAAWKAPDQIALRFKSESLSYGDLYERAGALANALLADGLQPGDRVGILGKKGLENAVALYGIMLAGGVYVPLDPFAPPARTGFVMRDSDIRRVVTSASQAETVQAVAESGLELETLYGPGEEDGLPYRSVSWAEVASFSTDAPVVSTTEQDLCYILYTSGSTGTPKGIMHTHRSALAWAEVTADTYRLGTTDVVTNYAPLHFDLSTLDYFGVAAAGATTVIIPEEHTKFAASLAGLLEAEQLTVFYTVPMALIQLGQPGILDGRDLGGLRLVLFGGEPMPIKHLRTIMAQLPGAQFVNVYGPTETNGCTHYPVPELPDAGGESLPIGYPYDNVETLVVDDDDEPVAPGEPGELLVRAPTLMRGYWGRDDLTEAAFYRRAPYGGLPDLFHRTGDLVAEDPAGALRFLGRKDRQIKARGYRVELDEVESVLLSHEGVHEAAVYATADADGVREIQAEVILEAGAETTAADLSGHLRASLPPYAVPREVRIRTAFPRTSSGKIDRIAMAAEHAAQLTTVGG
ncbi:MAG: amino acid adenylation domain-containing protein [Acidimicrobiia bacterium]|nr:amino acid adenylation domain-containing protein [Acidimicrobiia bacterium]NNF11486.1 amino acid adenylation domain-containing protein [Acidimicrobiia bacterium]